MSVSPNARRTRRERRRAQPAANTACARAWEGAPPGERDGASGAVRRVLHVANDGAGTDRGALCVVRCVVRCAAGPALAARDDHACDGHAAARQRGPGARQPRAQLDRTAGARRCAHMWRRS
eukprot:5231347-Prymnesium_polylepis.1